MERQHMRMDEWREPRRAVEEEEAAECAKLKLLEGLEVTSTWARIHE